MISLPFEEPPGAEALGGCAGARGTEGTGLSGRRRPAGVDGLQCGPWLLWGRGRIQMLRRQDDGRSLPVLMPGGIGLPPWIWGWLLAATKESSAQQS